MSLGYAIRRLLQMVPVVAGVIVLTFGIVFVLGDPTQLDAEGVDAAQAQEIRHALGLDRPVSERFLTYAGGLVRGDLGRSFQGPPVTHVIGERLGPTLLLTGTALCISTAVGLALGLGVARRPFGWFDQVVTGGALVGYAVPSFWLAQLVVLAVILPTGLFPVEGMASARGPYAGAGHVFDVFRHLVMPALVLATSEVALLARITRSGTLQQLGSDYVRTASAKGLRDDEVVSRHALPNALLPIVTVIGARIGFLLAGAVLVEAVFAWPGLGSLLVESARARDQPVVLGLVLLAAASVMLANLATDLVCAWVDPRLRHR